MKPRYDDLKIATQTVETASHVALDFCDFSDCRIGGLTCKWENKALQNSNNCKSFISFGKHDSPINTVACSPLPYLSPLNTSPHSLFGLGEEQENRNLPTARSDSLFYGTNISPNTGLVLLGKAKCCQAKCLPIGDLCLLRGE